MTDELKQAAEKLKQQVAASIKSMCAKENGEKIDWLNNHNFGICLGTGVSADVNKSVNGDTYLWNNLVYAILGEILKHYYASSKFTKLLSCPESAAAEIASVIDGIRKSGKALDTENTLECVEYLKNMAFANELSKQVKDSVGENFIALTVHDLFYGHDGGRSAEIEKKIKALTVSTKKNTLAETSRIICEQTEKYGSYHVLTYNYDDYTETALKYCYLKRKYPTLSSSELKNKIRETDDKIFSRYDNKIRPYQPGKIIVSHVHGYIPHDWDKTRMNGDFIFSEESYGNMNDEIYNWSNRTQSDYFVSQPTLFIGFSGVDASFRRLMQELKREREQNPSSYADEYYNHFLFMDYGKLTEEICGQVMEKTSAKDFDDDQLSKIARNIVYLIISSKTRYYKNQLGVSIFWHNGVDEISEILSRISVT